MWNYAPNAIIKPSTGSPTYDLVRVQFQCCSLEATTIQRVSFSGSQSGKTAIGFRFWDVFSFAFTANRSIWWEERRKVIPEEIFLLSARPRQAAFCKTRKVKRLWSFNRVRRRTAGWDHRVQSWTGLRRRDARCCGVRLYVCVCVCVCVCVGRSYDGVFMCDMCVWIITAWG